MALHLYNTLSRKKELFEPLNKGTETDKAKVFLYTCGPTVYHFVHIGNLRTFVFEDLLVRYLRYKGYEVFQVMNLTDVDDKTIRASQSEGVSLNEYTQKYKEAFFQDIQNLNILPAWKYPSAVEHIEAMIILIQKLLQRNLAYRNENSIYYRIDSFPRYGSLAGIEGRKEGASGRVSADEYDKENPSDFVLWKAYTEEDGEVFWETPLGKGRPGWHIECSAMSMQYLGESFDIHCGGVDNIFPHHENEIAQSEGATQKPFVRYWLHSEFLTIEGEKSSKSKGNVLYLKDLLEKGYSQSAVRLSLLQVHYRSRVQYSLGFLKQAESTLDTLNQFIIRCRQLSQNSSFHDHEDHAKTKRVEDGIAKMFREFDSALDDDLNIAKALGSIFSMIRYFNKIFDSLSIQEAQKILSSLKSVDLVLGILDWGKKENIDFNKENKENIQENIDENVQENIYIEELIKKREQSRRNKDFVTADQIRQTLKQKGILLEDTQKGTVWRKL